MCQAHTDSCDNLERLRVEGVASGMPHMIILH